LSTSTALNEVIIQALRKRKFLRKKFSVTDNVLCRVCADNTVKEMSSLS